jgi:acyl-CoA synthetase (AMP-forming)/AMP-acid ligase II
MRNAPATVATAFSLFTNRQALLALSDLRQGDRLAESIRTLGAVAIIGHPEDWAPAVKRVVAEIGALGIEMAADDPLDMKIRVQPGSTDAATEITRTGVALQLLTSGTTGPPKRISLTYESLGRAIAGASHYTSAQDDRPRLRKSVAVVPLPLGHIGGIWTTLLNFADGRAVALLRRFDVEAWLALVREHRPRVANVPPAALQMLMARSTAVEDLASLTAVTVGTAPLNPELAEQFEAKYGIAVLPVYGATEFGGGVAGWTLADHRRYARKKRGSVGRAHADVSLRIVDPDSAEPLVPGQTGLLELRAPQLLIDSPDGWMRTNDLASIDEDGFLWIRGRADDTIIRGGFKIQACEVSDVLRRYPGIRDAAVVGLPHDRLGEIPVAAIEPADGQGDRLDEDVIKEWSRQHLSPYQIPARILTVSALPRNAVLKIDATALREMIRKRAGPPL